MRKLLSALFSIFVIAVIVVAVYFNQQFCLHQIDKVKGMYYVHKGDQAYKVMNTKDAILYYNKGLRLYPKHYGAWYNLGNIYVAYEDYYSALNAYAQAFKYNPKMAIARMNYGIVSSEMLGDFDSALDQYDKIIKTKRKLITIPYVYNNKESYKENKAIAHYNKGVTYRLKSLYSTDDWELQRKYMSQAIQEYQKSIEINPDSYDAQYNLGTLYHKTGDYMRAGRCYCKAINVAPMNYEAHFNLALLLRKMGHHKEAFDEIDKSMTLITALDQNSSIQEYAVTVLNEIQRDAYQSYKTNKRLEEILKDKTARANVNQAIKKQKTKKKKNKKNKGDSESEITSKGVSFINGKVVPTAELDDVIREDFSKCPSSIYFNQGKDAVDNI